MNLFVLGMRRSGTTILYDALREDPDLRCFYEPLREERVTVGGGSGARAGDAFAETRELRRRFRDQRYPEIALQDFNWGGPREPELELEPALPEHCREFLRHLLEQAPEVAIKETRLHCKVDVLARLDPDAALVHVVRDPRAVCSSMLLGRRQRRRIYPTPDAFFTVRTNRKLWSSRAISGSLLAEAGVPADVPDFLRPLAAWQLAFEATRAAGKEHFGERYLPVRLEDLRGDPGAALGALYTALGRTAPRAVTGWAEANVRRTQQIEHADDPRWARAARLLHMEEAVTAAGYEEILALEGESGPPLDLEPPPLPSPLSAALGRARRRFGGGDPGAR